MNSPEETPDQKAPKTRQLGPSDLIATYPMIPHGHDVSGAMVYGAVAPPFVVHPGHVIAIRMWALAPIPMKGAGKFFMIVPGQSEQKAAELRFDVQKSDWLNEVNLGVVTLDITEPITAIKLGTVVAFQQSLALPSSVGKSISIENMWAEIYEP